MKNFPRGGEWPLDGWVNLAHGLGMFQRTALTRRKELKAAEVIFYQKKAAPFVMWCAFTKV